MAELSNQDLINKLENQELPSLPPEQEARIRAFINMLLDRVEQEQEHGIIRGNHD